MKEILYNTTLFYRDIDRIFAPLAQHFNFNYFLYVRVDNHGQRVALSNHPEWEEHHLAAGYYCTDLTYKTHPDFTNAGVATWAANEDELTHVILDDAKRLFNIANGINIVDKHADYYEVFIFAGPAENTSIYNFYLNDFHILRKFIAYFKEEASCIIEKCKKNPVNLLEIFKEKFYVDSRSNECEITKYKSFLKAINKNNCDNIEVNLTPRELICLKLYLEYKTAKEIGKILEISHKTAEFHIANLKAKFNCHTRAELFQVICEQQILQLNERALLGIV